MRYLIIDSKYPGFLAQVYQDQPGLEDAPYQEQMARIRSGLFGEVGFQVDALRSLGHEADSIVVNAGHAQRVWARENGVDYPAPRMRLRRWHGLPIVGRTRLDIAWDIVVEQVRRAAPDVIYVGILDTMPPAVVAAVRPFARLDVAQIAASTPDWDYRGYDLILSSIPAIVTRFRSLGIASEWMPLAFDPSVISEVPSQERSIPVSFVGSFAAAYEDRLAVCEAVAEAAPLHTWTPDASAIRSMSPVKPTIRGFAFGRTMYAVLARSLVTLNTHAHWSGPDANNLRLFEATGMGAMLLTDSKRNLADLFDVGTEVIPFDGPDDAASLARYYVDHTEEAARIAAAGQARTLRHHTWRDRMERIAGLVESRLGDGAGGLLP